MKQSRSVRVPSGVSSFFEICDTDPDGNSIDDPLKLGARGGGFIIAKGTSTIACLSDDIVTDEVYIGGKLESGALTSLAVIRLIRHKFEVPAVRVIHTVVPPIGQGFGTSGAGALSTSIALGDLFDLEFSLSQAAAFAHIAEIQSLTGLGTVISLASGTGAVGLVTEPGSFSIGRTDAILVDPEEYTLICAAFGPIEKSSVLSDKRLRRSVNEFGHATLTRILENPTVTVLLAESRLFSEKTGLASPELLKLSDKAVDAGAVGAAPNMIGNAIHCLVEKSTREQFMKKFSEFVPKEFLFESDLTQSGPRIISQ
jgi:pantoate kinase